MMTRRGLEAENRGIERFKEKSRDSGEETERIVFGRRHTPRRQFKPQDDQPAARQIQI